MRYQIIGDSSTDTTPELETLLEIRKAPLSVRVGETHFLDVPDLNVNEMLRTIEQSTQGASSAAPAPQDYLNCLEGTKEGAFIITLSSKLSGSYNSAMLAKQMFEEEHPGIKVHVVDSKSASIAQTLLAVKLKDYMDEGLAFDDIVEKIEDFRKTVHLKFVLDSLDTFVKNGRLGKLAGMAATLLHIKAVLGDDGEGEIGIFGKKRTFPKALSLVAQTVIDSPEPTENRDLFISYCCAYERAVSLKEQICAHRQFRHVYLVPMAGLSSTYASRGGIICAV